MNHVYRLAWKVSISQLVPVCEFGRRSRPGRSRPSRDLRAPVTALIGAICFSVVAQAGPTGGQVTSGSGQITQSGNTTTVRQDSQNLSLNWQSFNVAASETVNFVQPGVSSLAVNRVVGNSASAIFGHLNSNGQVWLINPNGVLFGKGSQVNVAGLVASTLDANDTSGSSRTFSGNGTGSVVNQGSINASNGGYVALLGNTVSNQGVVSARLGTVAIGAGSAATLSFEGNRLLQIQVDANTLDNLAQNNGLLAADGGTVLMTAGAKNSLLASTVNNTGVIRANTVENHNGTIVLTGGNAAGSVDVGGTVQAASASGSGGSITATAQQVTVESGAVIDASGGAGGGAIRIGGGWEGGEGVAQATTVSVANTATLNASATYKGDGGEIVVRSDVDNPDSTARAYGTLLALGGPNGGNGGRIETSGHWLDVSGIDARTTAQGGQAGEWLLDPYNVIISSTGSNISGSTYVPSANSTITASSIASALNSGTNVTITTGTTGAVIGDITVNAPITKASGNTDVTLTLQAADSVVVNQPISNTGGTGKLNVNLYADNDNGTHDGVGVVILNNSISTGGGSINFGTGSTMTVNGAANTLVGGDVYVGGSSAVNLTTAGGNVAINGQLIIANTNGLNIDTTNGGSTGGNVTFAGTIDSGDTYQLVTSFGNVGWNTALVDAKSGVGAAVGDTYLATLTSRLENAVAGYTVGYTASWLGGERVFGLGTDAEWRWVGGPEGLQDNGHGLAFFTQNATNTTPAGNPNGTAINGAYINWNPATPEPNNYGGTSLSQSGSGEWVLQFVGTQGQWNDLNPTSNSLPFVKETNLANSPLTVNAGSSGTVTFRGAIGQQKPLAQLDVTGNIIGLNSNSTNIATSGPITLNGQVQVNNVNYDVLIVTAPSVTTTYGATLPTFTPTYSGFKNGDTVASLTQQATATTSGSTSYVSTAPIVASGAVDPNYYIIYNPGTLTVNPAPLTVTGTVVATKTYDGTTSASLSGGMLAGVLSSDLAHLTLTQSGVFISPNAGASVGVTVSDVLGGTAAGNYTLVQPTGVTGTINQAHVTVTGTETAASKTYNGTTAAVISGGILSGILPADSSHVSLQGNFQTANAGTSIPVIDSLTGSAAANYVIISQPTLSANINPALLSLAGNETAASKTYDGTTAATLSGGGLTGVIPADSGLVSVQGSFVSANAGQDIPVTVALTGAQAGNYQLVSAPSLAANINPALLSIAGTEVAGSKTYDGTTAVTLSGGTLSGVLPADAGAVSLLAAFASANAGQNIAVITSLTGSAASNYALQSPLNLAADINPAPLLATAAPALLAVGGSAPALTGSFSGFVDGETLSSLSAAGYQFTWTTAAAGRSAAGQYAIVGSTTDPNYAVVQAAANASALTASVQSVGSSTSAGNQLVLVSTGGSGAFGSAGGAGAGVGSAGAGTSNVVADAGGASGGSAANATSGATSADAGTGGSQNSTAAAAGASSSEASVSGTGGADTAPNGSQQAVVADLGGRRLFIVDGGVNTSVTEQ